MYHRSMESSSSINMPKSPTFSTRSISTQPSQLHLDLSDPPAVILTRKDVRASIDSLETLIASSKAYRQQMMQLSQAAAAFGSALEGVARNKAAGLTDAGSGLQAASGLHFLMSNHHQILSDTFYKSFEIPLLESLDLYKSNVLERETTYEKQLGITSRKIRETEEANLRHNKKKQRDLNSFRQALANLTSQVEELDRLKTGYYREVLDTETSNLDALVQMVSIVVRAEIDIYERIASKGIADPVLEPMMTNATDPFSTFETRDEREIFSILPPLSMSLAGGAAIVSSGYDRLSKPNSTKEAIEDIIPEEDETEQENDQEQPEPEPEPASDGTSPPHTDFDHE